MMTDLSQEKASQSVNETSEPTEVVPLDVPERTPVAADGPAVFETKDLAVT